MNSIRNFRRKILQMSIFCTQDSHIEDLGLILVDAFDHVESCAKTSGKKSQLKSQEKEELDVEMQSKTESEEPKQKLEENKTPLKIGDLGGNSWIPQDLEEKDISDSGETKSNEFIKYRLNNPRVTKKGDKAVSEGI